MEKIYENENYSEERALYGVKGALIKNCTFISEIGESPLKECRKIDVINCNFSMRYPLWHAQNFTVEGCHQDSLTRAALWYCKNGIITNCTLGGIKALRECQNIELYGCNINSPEFGWRCRDVKIENCEVVSEYFLFECKNINIQNLKMRGKYSFQYVKGGIISNSEFDTKDAFWHSENLIVKNSILRGEYLGWYSKNLTLENCLICGTQPLCYCKGLRLINCRTQGCDLAFENSEVYAQIHGDIVSVKNPKSGKIEISGNYTQIFDGCIKSTCKIERFDEEPQNAEFRQCI